MAVRLMSDIRLVNGSTGDPVLFVDYPGKDDAILFDGGDNAALPMKQLGDLEAAFITHHHIDHFMGLDRIIRANIDGDKTLTILGPVGTIRKVYDRIKSYEFMYFPFQKIVIRVQELLEDRMRTALLECRRRFPEPTIQEEPWTGPVVYENRDLRVEAGHADHTVPCLSFALVEKGGYHPSREKLANGALRPGRWIGEALDRFRDGASLDEELEIEGGRFKLRELARQYFRRTKGSRVAYVTDTAWSRKSQPVLLRLAKEADRLYCDSFYSEAQKKQADKYFHMTATRAARLAKRAKVAELVLMHFARRYTGRYESLLDEARAIFPKARAEGI